MFNKGDVVYHKATGKKCVVSHVEDGKVWVTTQDDEKRMYISEELEKEEER